MFQCSSWDGMEHPPKHTCSPEDEGSLAPCHPLPAHLLSTLPIIPAIIPTPCTGVCFQTLAPWASLARPYIQPQLAGLHSASLPPNWIPTTPAHPHASHHLLPCSHVPPKIKGRNIYPFMHLNGSFLLMWSCCSFSPPLWLLKHVLITWVQGAGFA